MKTVTIFGASDDLIEVCGDIEGCDEFNNCAQGPYMGCVHIEAGDFHLQVHAIYAGGWGFGITTEGGDYDEYPPWDIKREFGTESSYSETVTVEVPDTAKVRFTKKPE